MPSSEQESYACNKVSANPALRRLTIQRLNDALRQTFVGGHVTITPGVRELGAEGLQSVLLAVQRYDHFGAGNDPYNEHDFGSFSYGAEQLFWKIDYNDKRLEAGSPDPSNPAVTTRVITIMLAQEYRGG